MVKLQVLVLNNCKIDDELAILLAEAMKNCVFLTHFDVQNNFILEKGFEKLIKRITVVMIQSSRVQPPAIPAKGNRIGHKNLEKLLKLPSPINPVRYDEAYHVKIGIRIYMKVGVLSLRDLCVSVMNLGDKGLIIIANSFVYLINLRTLYYYNSAAGKEGADAILEKLLDALALEYFDLSGNYIPPEYDEKFERMNKLREKAGLPRVTIDLSDQLIVNNDEEAEAIVRRIPSMADGTEIDFFIERKKFTTYGRGLIEAANELRKKFNRLPLKIIF